MKKIIAIIFVTLLPYTAFGQNFEGKFTYQNSYRSKIPNIKDEQLTSMMGTKQEYYIKAGDYKSVTNGTFCPWQLYINKENKLYTKLSNSETILWNDGSLNSDSIINVQLNKEVTEVLGYKCDELIFTCKSGIQKYYFNSKFGVSPQLYENHKYNNWYDYLIQAKALPLKIIIDNAQCTLENVVTAIKPMKIDDKEFQLPADVKTAKSPY